MANGTKENPFTRDDPGASATYRCWRFCKCSACGKVKQCSPDCDFYYPATTNPTTGKDDQPAQMLCDPCHDTWLTSFGLKVIDQRPLTKTQYERGQKREGMN